ncbi:MAG: TlpA disulfide reductase family protein, partial [Nevskiales bacterium]
MHRGLIIGVIALLALLAGVFSYQLREQQNPLRSDFRLQDLQANPVTAADFDGQLVILNALQAEYAEQGLQILGPAVDKEAAVKDFVAETALQYPVLLGMAGVLKLQDSYGQQALPFTVVIGRDGRVIYQH